MTPNGAHTTKPKYEVEGNINPLNFNKKKQLLR